MPADLQDQVHQHSLTDPHSFWSAQASHLHWHKKPTQILNKTRKALKSGTVHDHWAWFADGEISTCYNCVDRHVEAGHGEQTAIIFDSPVTNVKTKYTYKELLKEVEVFAGVLRDEGVKKGDVVLVYSEQYIPNDNASFLTHYCSANDTCSLDRYPRHFQTWCHTCGSIWWIRSSITRATNRSLETSRNTYSFLWYRRIETANVV